MTRSFQTIEKCRDYYQANIDNKSICHVWIQYWFPNSDNKETPIALHPNKVQRKPLIEYHANTWLYVVLYDPKKELAWPWGYVSVASLYITSSSSSSSTPYSHHLLSPKQCSLSSLPIPYSMKDQTPKLVPIVPPQKEFTVSDMWKFFHQRFIWYHYIHKEEIPSCPVSMSILTSRQIQYDHFGIHIMKLFMTVYCPSLTKDLSAIMNQVIYYEMCLLKERLRTCFLPCLFILWHQFLTYLGIEYTQTTDQPPPLHSKHKYLRWYILPFEHIPPILIKKRMIVLEGGQGYIHEGYVFELLPFYYERILRSMLLTEAGEYTEFKKRHMKVFQECYQIDRYINYLIKNILYPSIPMMSSSSSSSSSIEYINKKGPKCIQKMIKMVNTPIHLKNNQRQLLYSAMLKSNVNLNELTQWLSLYFRRLYHTNPTQARLKINQSQPQLKYWSSAKDSKEYGCQSYIDANLCGCTSMDQDDIEDIGVQTPQQYCTRQVMKNKQQQVPVVIITRPSQYIVLLSNQ